jgi:hypothetical protein
MGGHLPCLRSKRFREGAVRPEEAALAAVSKGKSARQLWPAYILQAPSSGRMAP